MRRELPHLLLIAGAMGTLLAFLRWGSSLSTGSFSRDAILVLVGIVGGVAAGSVVAIATRSEAYRQGSYTERAKAVQEIVDRARGVKASLVQDWPEVISAGDRSVAAKRRMTMLDHLMGLLNRSFYQRVWIGEAGVDAVRQFNASMTALNLERMPNVRVLEEEVGAPFRELEDALMADLGFRSR